MSWDFRTFRNHAETSLLLAILALALLGLTSCGAAPVSTAVTCTTNSSTSSSSTSASTCTDPTTNISITISPATASVNVVTTQQFSAFLSGGTNNVITWKVNNIQGGNSTLGLIDSNGLYHAPVTVPSPSTVTVTATSFEDQNLTATSSVTITPAPVVTITSPAGPVTVASGSANPINFTASETGGTTNVIVWSVGPVGGLGVEGGNSTFGFISANGVYTPPLTPPIGQTVTVTAAAQDAPNSSATLNITVAGYSLSSFAGQFAFSVSGSNSAGHFFRAGSFTANGSGLLTSVLEDANSTAGATSTPVFTTGSYTLGADGRGTLQFNDGLTPATYNFVLVSGTQLEIIGFDATGTATGQANAQTLSTFTSNPDSAFNGTYIFDFSGVDGAKALSQIGVFTADGAGNITKGSVDINDGGTATPLQIAGTTTVCSPAPAALSTYAIGSTGRGTLTIETLTSTCVAGPTLTLNFYVVSGGGAKFVGTNTVQQVAGYTSQQAPNASFNAGALSGNYAFLLAGTATSGPIATAGSLFADGSGNLTSGVVDENLNGTPAPNLPLTSAGTYTVAANGRGTATFTTAGRTYNVVFYLGAVGTTPTVTNGVFQETDAGIASDGSLALQQPAAFTLASIEGNYAVETSGSAGASLQVSTGEFAANGAGVITSGSIDVNTAGTLQPGQPVTGNYGAPTAAGRAALGLNSANYAGYVISPTQLYLLGIQTGQVSAGALLRQF